MQTQEQKNLKPIRLLTFNIFIRPPLVNDFGNDYKDERLAYFTKEILPNYDVICLQEIYEVNYSTRKEEFIEAARKQGFTYHASSDRPAWFDT